MRTCAGVLLQAAGRAAEILGHLADATGHYEARDARKSVELFRAVRDANLALLRSLEPAQWALYGVHSERGRESIEDMVRMTAGHDVNHLRQIEQIVVSA